MAILDYRNTPTQGMDSSPVQRLMNRRAKTLLPTSRTLLQPRVTYPEKDQQNLAKRQEQQVRYFNQGARDLRELAEGDVVRMKPFRLGDKVWKKATVTACLNERSYNIEMPDRGVYRRTRCNLRKTPERVESVSSDVSKSAEKGVRSSGEQIMPAEPAVSLPIPEAEQQEQTGEPPKTIAPSLTPPGPVNMQPVRPQRTRTAPNYLKDFVCNLSRQTIKQSGPMLSY